LGDAKLFSAAGAWVGLEGLPSVLLCASVIAIAFAGVARAGGETVTAVTRIPFGPYLAFGFWIVWIYGPMTFGL
jgi:leader peptidase (prepilin peptidase) / N-methyltransferase